MSALQNFEEFVEQTVEGSISRLFRSPIQPVEIERRLVRVMEQNQTISAGHTYVPNRYRVQLHPDDYKAVIPQRHLWEREIAAFITGLCQERGYTLVQRPVVTISASSESRRRTIHIHAALHDSPTGGLPDDPEAPPLQPTAAMPIVRPAAPGRLPQRPVTTPPRVSLQMLTANAPGAPLLFSKALITIGRELDNDLVIEDSRVSRHHAQLLYQHDRYVVRDLGSTNGTFVNGQPVTTLALHPGDQISFGGVEAQFSLERGT